VKDGSIYYFYKFEQQNANFFNIPISDRCWQVIIKILVIFHPNKIAFSSLKKAFLSAIIV
ncbi:hypothetical protein, partial [Streptococcus pneumoniae]